MAFLKVIQGSSSGQTLALSSGKVVLGRHPTCQIVLDNASVSRHHAQLTEINGGYFLEDLRSRNGTILNGQSIRGRAELRDGDEIRVCDYAFQFLLASTGPAIDVILDSGFVDGSARVPDVRAALGTVDAVPDSAMVLDVGPLDKPPVIASMSAGTSEHALRLNVRPEAKLRAILEISLSLSKVLNLADMLPVILKSLFKIFPQADSGFILLKDSITKELRFRASYSRGRDEDQVPISMTVVKQAMDTGNAILSADLVGDRRFEYSDSIVDQQLRSLMCTPLVDTNGDASGVLQLSTRDSSQPFNSDDLDLLVSVAAQASLAVQNAEMYESLQRQRDVDRDMEVAAQVQLGFLPASAPCIPGYEFADYYEAARRIGGDYFDYVRLSEGRFAVVIGDVSGKGIPAALLMARLHASCRHHLLDVTSAEQALNGLNQEMSSSDLGYRFITLSIGILDPIRHELQLASAGHLPPIVRHSAGTSEFIGIKESGMPLGVTTEQVYSSFIIRLEPDDTIVFYTDGITESLDQNNELFGKERLRHVVETGPAAVPELVPALVDAVKRFHDGAAQHDDICVTALRRIS